jgi:hypothetical protein
MKARILMLFCILCLAVLIILGSCATMKSPDKMTYERFVGTWANKNYEQTGGFNTEVSYHHAKYIVNPDGTFMWHEYLDQTGLTAVGTYTVEKRWKDADGNNLYHVKVYEVLNQVTLYELWKIDKYASVWECNSSNIDYPDEIDPSDYHSDYRIFYRY